MVVQLGLEYTSVITWVFAIQGCLLRGVPLYYPYRNHKVVHCNNLVLWLKIKSHKKNLHKIILRTCTYVYCELGYGTG